MLRDRRSDEPSESAKIILDATVVLPKKPHNIKRPWITTPTFELIQQRAMLKALADPEPLIDLRRRIKTAARQDKRAYVLNAVRSDLHPHSKWLGLKRLKT